MHSKLSHIKDWTIRIGKLTGLDENLRDKAEILMDIMYRERLYLFRGWLNYWNEEYEETVKPRIEEETISIFLSVIEKLRKSKSHVTKIEIIEAILNIIEERLREYGIPVYKNEFKLFITRMLGADLQRTSLERLHEFVIDSISRGDLSGRWIVFVPVPNYPKVFSRIVNSLEENGLAHSATILTRRILTRR